MQQAWEYEKEGMGLQYNYGQQYWTDGRSRSQGNNRRSNSPGGGLS